MLKNNEIFLIRGLKNLSIIEIFKQTVLKENCQEIYPVGKFPKIKETLRKRRASLIFSNPVFAYVHKNAIYFQYNSS
jgi:hypothetical protein